MILNDVYEQLNENNLCPSKQQFSQKYLGRSKCYLSVLIKLEQEPSTHVLMGLFLKLRERSTQVDDKTQPVLIKAAKVLSDLSKDVNDEILGRF